MTVFRWAALALLEGLMLVGPAMADGPVSKATSAVDPNCTPTKAAKGAAMKATMGVGNRCGVAETARDAVGIDGKKSTGVVGRGDKKDNAQRLLKQNSD